MDSPPWFDELRSRLVRQGLPTDYVRRLVGELNDHFQDLKEETMHTDVEAYAQLGKVEEVARAATTAYRQRSFLGRHLWAALLVFVVSPVALSIVAMPVAIFAAYWFGRGLGYWDQAGVHLGAWGRTLLPYGLTLAAIVLPAALLCLFYCRVAQRIGLGRRWMLLSCGVLAVFAAVAHCQVLLDPSGHGTLTVGLGAHDLLQLAQPVLPVILGGWFLRRTNAACLQLTP
jgi:hypothetical protein